MSDPFPLSPFFFFFSSEFTFSLFFFPEYGTRPRNARAGFDAVVSFPFLFFPPRFVFFFLFFLAADGVGADIQMPTSRK